MTDSESLKNISVKIIRLKKLRKLVRIRLRRKGKWNNRMTRLLLDLIKFDKLNERYLL